MEEDEEKEEDEDDESEDEQMDEQLNTVMDERQRGTANTDGIKVKESLVASKNPGTLDYYFNKGEMIGPMKDGLQHKTSNESLSK